MLKKMLNKIMITFHKLTKNIMKIKLIKALIGLITVLMSYKIVNYFFKFNKLIIYLFGLIFVGFNWSDYHVLNEIKLIWDSLKLYFLNLLPNNEITDEMKVSTKKDMTEIIIYKDHTNISNEIDDDYVYVIADKIPEVKSIRNEIKESHITDGNGNSWTFTEILTNPLIIFVIVSAIIVSGTIIVFHYDLTLDLVTTYTWTHIKAGFTVTVLFIGKIIKYFNNDPRPPIDPNDPPIDLNPNLILDKGKGPMVLPTVFGPEKPPFFDTIQSDPVLKTKSDILNKITEINSHMEELIGKPSTSENAAKLNFLIKKSDELKERYIQFEPNAFGSGDSTPIAFRSPVDTKDLELPNTFED